MSDEINPAHCLSGIDLGNGWLVGEKLTKEVGGTGGHFSVGYCAIPRLAGSCNLTQNSK